MGQQVSKKCYVLRAHTEICVVIIWCLFTKLGLGLGLGLEMHKTINRRAHRREVAIACARATSLLPSAADGGHDD